MKPLITEQEYLLAKDVVDRYNEQNKITTEDYFKEKILLYSLDVGSGLLKKGDMSQRLERAIKVYIGLLRYTDAKFDYGCYDTNFLNQIQYLLNRTNNITYSELSLISLKELSTLPIGNIGKKSISEFRDFLLKNNIETVSCANSIINFIYNLKQVTHFKNDTNSIKNKIAIKELEEKYKL